MNVILQTVPVLNEIPQKVSSNTDATDDRIANFEKILSDLVSGEKVLDSNDNEDVDESLETALEDGAVSDETTEAIISAMYQMYDFNTGEDSEDDLQSIIEGLSDNSNTSDISWLTNSYGSSEELAASLIAQAEASANTDEVKNKSSTTSENESTIDVKASQSGLEEIFSRITEKFPQAASSASFQSTMSSYATAKSKMESIRNITSTSIDEQVVFSNEISENTQNANPDNEIIANVGDEINASMQNTIDINAQNTTIDINAQNTNDVNGQNAITPIIQNEVNTNAEKINNSVVPTVDENSVYTTSFKVNVDKNGDDSLNDMSKDNADSTDNQGFDLNSKISEASNFTFDEKIETVDVSKSILDQVKNQISVIRSSGLKEGVNEIRMKLNPENLGTLDIKLTLEKGNLSIDILAENSKTQNIILQNIDQLEEALKQNMNNNVSNAKSNSRYEQQNNDSQGKNNQNSSNSYYESNNEDDEDGDFSYELSKILNLGFNKV